MKDEQIAASLKGLGFVETCSQGIRNKIVKVGTDRVTVRSERTGNDRVITFNSVRDWAVGRSNSRVRLALAVALGLAKRTA